MNKTARIIRKFTTVALVLGVSGCGGDVATNSDFNIVDPTQPVSDWQLVWSDEFEGTSIDRRKWNHEINCWGGGNNEKQCYTDNPENSYVSGGTLKIVALPADDGEPLPYTSARLSSKYQGDWKYGRIEVRAKLPYGQGSWPAIWMLPTDNVYGEWPKSGEIDIMEAVNLKTVNADGEIESNVHGTLHYGRLWPDNVSSGKGYELPGNTNPADDFHVYAIEWQEGEIRWYVDGYLYQTQMASSLRYNSRGEIAGLRHRGWFSENFDIVTGKLETHWGKAPFDQRFHLLLNLAVGGNWPENVNNLGIDATAFENGQILEVDYVRVYQCATNPETGKGCETVRAGYKDADTLVIGEAPLPPPPASGIARNLTIFDGEINPVWPAWDCCGGSTPAIVADNTGRGSVYEFVVGAQPTVNGFISRSEFIVDPDVSATPFDATPLLEKGSISFDMLVVSAPANQGAAWLFKVESSGNSPQATAAEMFITASVEGEAPVTGQWQSYTFPLQMLSDAGLDVSAIDAVMIFPAWGDGEGAVYRIDNVRIAQPLPELLLFADEQNLDWPLWDCCGGTIPTEEIDDAQHGVTAQFVIGSEPTVMGFKSETGIQFDATALLAEGVVQFDMKVVSAPSNQASTWLFKIESDNASTAVELDLASGNNGQGPVTGAWQTYTFSLLSLSDAGLDVSAIDVIMVFPAWGTGDGAVYRLDNVRIYQPNNN